VKSGLQLSPEQLATITIETVGEAHFAGETVTEGKISADEDRVTPVFSQFAGRVTKISARPGQQVKQGEPLFTLEAVDVIQSENDLMSAVSTLNKSRSSLRLAQTAEKRLRDLAAANAVAQREFQQAQNDLNSAQNDVRAAEIALEAVRNRLRIMRKSDTEITNFEQTGKISTETVNNKPVLLIEGSLVDVARKSVDIPRLRFIVRDAKGADIYAWNAVLEQPIINPGEKAWFKTRLASPPAEGREIAVRFFHKSDVASGGT